MTARRPTAACLLTWLAAVLFAAPLVLLVCLALQPASRELPTGWDLLPLAPDLGSLREAFRFEPLFRELLNSGIVAALAVPGSVLFASWAGFGMLLLGPRARRRALTVAGVLMLVPPAALWVPRFVLFSRLDLVDSYVPLVAPALLGTTTLAMLLMHHAYRRIAPELLDAGRLAGLGPLRLWWTVGEPLARPTAFAVAALVFVAHWGAFVEPLLYLFSRDLYTLPQGLRSLYAVGAGGTTATVAATLVATLPPVVVFLAAQRRFLDAAPGALWHGR